MRHLCHKVFHEIVGSSRCLLETVTTGSEIYLQLNTVDQERDMKLEVTAHELKSHELKSHNNEAMEAEMAPLDKVLDIAASRPLVNVIPNHLAGQGVEFSSLLQIKEGANTFDLEGDPLLMDNAGKKREFSPTQPGWDDTLPLRRRWETHWH